MSTHCVLLPHQFPVLAENIEPSPELPPSPETRLAAAAPRDNEDRPGMLQEEFVHRVMRELELQVEVLLETRLRKILMPAIARATEQPMRETREEVASLAGRDPLAQLAGALPFASRMMMATGAGRSRRSEALLEVK